MYLKEANKIKISYKMDWLPYCSLNFSIIFLIFQEQALESSKAARDKEWNSFLNDCKDKKQNVDDAYLKKENDIRDRYAKLEENLNS